MRLQPFALLCLVTSTLAAASAEFGPAPKADPRQLLEEVNQNGARKTVLRLARSQADWSAVMERIASGQKAWIDLAVALKPGSDAAQGAALYHAMLRAMARNPSYVLTHAQPDYPLALLCLGRPDPPPAYREATAELDAAKEALEKMKTVELRYQKELCLAQLREGQARLRRLFRSGGK